MSDIGRNRLGLDPSEGVLLLVILSISLTILLLSFRYEGFTATYPLFLAVATLAVTGLLVVRNLVPRNMLYEILFTSPDIFSTERFADDEGGESTDEADESDTRSGGDSLWRTPVSNRVGIIGSVVGYLVLGFLVGLLWATPVYVFGYLYWMNTSRLRRIALTAASFGIVFLFQQFINVPVATGFVHQVIF